MKIVFDLDGTLTDFNKFVWENAIPYFEYKYSIKPQNPKSLEIEDILGLNLACSEDKKKLDNFWISPMFVKFSLLGRFRKGVRASIKYFSQKGFEVEIHSSRAKTCNRNFIGKIAKIFNIIQIRANAVFIPKSNIYFYENDEEKLKGILRAKPLLVFDDKVELVEEYAQNKIKTVCVAGIHNEEMHENKYLAVLHSFTREETEQVVTKLLGKRNWECILTELDSQLFFNRIFGIAKIIQRKFHPIVLHIENIADKKQGVIYAPNHRSTLDPLVLECVIKKNIHWAALLRFFRAEDSIFNNSKNPFLCKLTRYIFNKLHYFPIDRKSDNPDANNFDSIREMNLFLRNKFSVGIFAEGTTRRPTGADFGKFDDAFIILAKKNDAWIQPITILWIKEVGLREKVIVNFSESFRVGEMSKEEAFEKFLNTQKRALDENKQMLQALVQRRGQ